MQKCEIYQGEPLDITLLVIEGAAESVATVEAVLKKAGPNKSVPYSDAEPVFTFTSAAADAPDVGWKFSLTAVQTETLAPGYYITNAKLNLVTGGPIKSEPILVKVKPSVS